MLDASPVRHLTLAELDAGLRGALTSPKDEGTLELIVRRPALGRRDVLETGELDVVTGLVGDTWNIRASKRTRDGSPHPDMQITLMNSRVIAVIAGEKTRWGLAGDQLYVDFDISAENVPPRTRLAIGSAIVEVTDQPHTGCAKFLKRFGVDATKFVNSPRGLALQLRGINARVIEPGRIQTGDRVQKLRTARRPPPSPL
jgi:MOSC domain-containing protein YiiM